MRHLIAALSIASSLLLAPAVHARPCATTALLALERSGGAPALDLGIGDRPTDIAAVFDSATHRLRVHTGTGVGDADGQAVLAFVEAAWDAQVTAAGFPEPIADGVEGGDDRFDVYVVPLPDGLGGVTIATGDLDAADGKHASPAFMQIDPTLPDELLEVFAHHEFQHALQFALDTQEAIMWFEATAVYWEVRARPDVTDWTLALADFQGQPQAPIFGTGATVAPIATIAAERYEYGAVLFALYLDEVHGDGQGTVLRQIWQAAIAPDTVDDNEPDFLDAMVTASVDPGAALTDFSTWRALVGPFTVADDGPLESVPASGILAAVQLNAATLDGDVRTSTDEEGPFPLGCLVRAVAAPANVDSMPVAIRAETTLDGQQLALGTVVLDANLHTATRTTGDATDVATASVDVPRGTILQVSVCDVTRADDSDAFTARPVRLSIGRTDVEFPDAGPPLDDAGPAEADGGPAPPPEPMCGCQSTPGSDGASAGDPRKMRAGLGVLGMLVGLFGFGVRGYRHAKRKRLYRRDGGER